MSDSDWESDDEGHSATHASAPADARGAAGGSSSDDATPTGPTVLFAVPCRLSLVVPPSPFAASLPAPPPPVAAGVTLLALPPTPATPSYSIALCAYDAQKR